jgi:hypothetical protein
MTTAGPVLRPGEQLASAVCATRVVVVRAPAGESPLVTCGGEPMIAAASRAGAGAGAASGEGTLIGKRYVNEAGTLELLCTSSGAGTLSCDGIPMTIKAAKPLPASDLRRRA